MLAPGDAAPTFTLTDMEGQDSGLADLLASGPVLLVLFKVSCPVCQLALPYLERIAQGSLRVVAISQDDSRSTRRFQHTFGITMRTLLDSEEKGYPVSNEYKITHVPALFLVEQDGVISRSGSGFRKTEIEDLGRLSGVAPFRQDDHVPEWKAG